MQVFFYYISLGYEYKTTADLTFPDEDTDASKTDYNYDESSSSHLNQPLMQSSHRENGDDSRESESAQAQMIGIRTSQETGHVQSPFEHPESGSPIAND